MEIAAKLASAGGTTGLIVLLILLYRGDVVFKRELKGVVQDREAWKRLALKVIPVLRFLSSKRRKNGDESTGEE